MTATTYEKPLPEPDIDSKEYWQGCKEHKLLLQRCKKCGNLRWPPVAICSKCRSFDFEWIPSLGTGTVYAWIVIVQSNQRGFADEVPYAVVTVELDDQPGLRLPSNLVGCDPREIKANMPVEVVFEGVTPEISLPKFRPRR